MTWIWSCLIDFDNDGYAGTDDVSAYLEGVDIQGGLQDDRDSVAAGGECTLVLDNQDRTFSPLNSLSPYYGKLKDGLPVLVKVYENYNAQAQTGTAYTLFNGKTGDFQVATGQYKERTVSLVCRDAIDRLQTDSVSLPLQVNQRTDVLIAKVVNAIFRAGVASDTVTLSGLPGDGNTVTFTWSDLTTTRVYTFRSAIAAPGDVLIGATKELTASYLAAAINNDAGAGTTYYAATQRGDEFTATVSGAVVTATASSAGAWGNNIALAKVGANISVGSANFTGGTDLPAGLTSYQVGKNTPDYAGDDWNTEAQTNGMNAIEDITKTEQGLFFAQRDGTLTFFNRDELFKRVTTAATLTLDSEHQELTGGQFVEDIYNRVEVKYTPRSLLSSGIVASAKSVITVPGQSGTARWNGTVVLPGGGNIVVKLPFVDPATGQPMGARSIIAPLVANTDFTVNDQADGLGFDYTTSGNISFSLVINGDSVEISIANNALGPLYVTMLKVRGTGIVRYNPSVVTREDSTNWSTRGRRTLTLDIPFSFTGVDTFADVLAQYALSRYKDQNYRIKAVTFNDFTMVGTTSLFSVTIGDLLSLSDYQSLIATSKHMVIGLTYSLRLGQKSRITYNVKKVDDTTYWILEDATYGVLGTTTRLAL